MNSLLILATELDTKYKSLDYFEIKDSLINQFVNISLSYIIIGESTPIAIKQYITSLPEILKRIHSGKNTISDLNKLNNQLNAEKQYISYSQLELQKDQPKDLQKDQLENPQKGLPVKKSKNIH